MLSNLWSCKTYWGQKRYCQVNWGVTGSSWWDNSSHDYKISLVLMAVLQKQREMVEWGACALNDHPQSANLFKWRHYSRSNSALRPLVLQLPSELSPTRRNSEWTRSGELRYHFPLGVWPELERPPAFTSNQWLLAGETYVEVKESKSICTELSIHKVRP